MEDFSVEVRQIAHDENEDRLDNSDVVREAGHESSEEAPDDADQSAANCHDEEGSKTGQYVRVFDVFHAHADVLVEHIVQHLKVGTREI